MSQQEHLVFADQHGPAHFRDDYGEWLEGQRELLRRRFDVEAELKTTWETVLAAPGNDTAGVFLTALNGHGDGRWLKGQLKLLEAELDGELRGKVRDRSKYAGQFDEMAGRDLELLESLVFGGGDQEWYSWRVEEASGGVELDDARLQGMLYTMFSRKAGGRE